MQTAVHQLWPPPGDMRKTEMNILFFQSYPRDPDDWKSAWTQRMHPDVCWPEKWLPADLGFDVRVLFASFSAYSILCYVVDDLFKALVMRDEWDLCKNHQPLVLVGRGFGTRVLDDLFLKATEEVLTSPTEAGAFVRNVRGVTLYGHRDQSYKIEKFFGGRSEDIFHLYTRGYLSSRRTVFVTQGSMLINPAIYGKNLTRDVVGLDPCQWIREDIWEDWDPEVRWKPESKQSRGYILLLESCRMVYQFEAIRAILEHLQQKLDNITTACDISNYSDSMFENEFTYLQRNGIEGARILIVQRMLATVGVDVEQHMVAKKSDDGEQLENERKLAILKFTVARFCESHEWHMVPKMKESDMRHEIESSLNDVVHGISPLSDDVVNKKMHEERRERERERVRESYLSGREAFRRDGNDTVPIHFPSIREQSIMSVKQLQQLACNMRPGENLPQEDVQEQLTAHMAQVLHGGKLIVTANILEGKIQFLFGNGKSMAQIVGVGLDFATVSLTRQNVIVVEGITELEWTRLWGEVFLGESLFENPIFMEKVVISPPDHEKPQGSHVNALSKVAMFFMMQKFLQNLDVGKVYNQVVRGVTTTMIEENQSDIGQVHAKSVNDPSTGILGFNLWDYLSRLQITRGLGSATRDTNTSGEGGSHLGGTDTPSEGDKDQGGDGGLGSATRDTSGEGGSHLGGTDTPSEGEKDQGGDGGLGSATRDTSGKGGSHLGGTDTPSEGEKDQGGDGGLGSATRDTSGDGGSHLGGTDTPNEGDKDQGGDGGEDNDNRKGRGAKGKEIQQNNQQDLPSTGILGFNQWDWSSWLPFLRGPGSSTRDTSGKGSSHLGGTDTPNEGDKDQGGDGGEDDDNRKGQGAKGNEIQQNNQQDVRVIVIPGSEHGVWNRNPVPNELEGSDIDPIIPEQLKGSYITPTLTFLFKKTENTIESEVSVTCCMNKGSSCQDSKRFGWFQNELDVSFQCLEPDAATPSPSELLGSQNLKDTILEQTQANPAQLTLGMGGGVPGIASAKVTTLLASSSKLCQRGTEMPHEFISGTRFRAYRVDRGGARPMLGYYFKLSPDVPTDKLPDGSDEDTLCTVSPNFKANWRVKRQDVICEYELKVKRHACELVLVAGKRKIWELWKQKLSCACNKMLQTYMVTLYINHNMSNIATLAESERTLWKDNPKNKLVGLGVHPSSPAFDEASSSTQ
ncbi:unnamed protein product [Sphagnum compactum]